MLLDRLVGSEDEPLLDRLVWHRALAGPELTFLQAQLAHRRIDAPLPPRAQQAPAAHG